MKAILFLTSCQCGHLNKVGSQATWTVAVSSGEGDCSPAAGTEKGLRADRDLSSPLPRLAMEVSPDTRGGRGVQLLLLLRLLVVTAAVDCPKPQGRGKMVLSDEALLINHFPETSSVTLECANGYVQENGSGIITCIDGNWSEPDLICKKKDCGPPKPQPNMRFITSTDTLFGAVIRVVCDKGFHLSGSSFKQCFATGWSGRAKCEIVECDKPGEVTNGRSSWDSQDYPKYGEIIQYVCNEGYTLVGNNSIVCGDTGEYDDQPPECKEASMSTDSSATSTAHRDTSITTTATPTVSLSVEGVSDIFPAEDQATTTRVTSTTPSSFIDFFVPRIFTVPPILPKQSSEDLDKHDGPVDTNKYNGYTPVIVSVIFVSLASCILVVCLHKFLLKRKGSYDTREDLKPELLQFQNL